jgi:hypothetical protein
MSKTHLQTAHEYGVKQALQQLGYASVDEVQKQAAELGLVEEDQQKTAAPQDVTASIFAELSRNLGK